MSIGISYFFARLVDCLFICLFICFWRASRRLGARSTLLWLATVMAARLVLVLPLPKCSSSSSSSSSSRQRSGLKRSGSPSALSSSLSSSSAAAAPNAGVLGTPQRHSLLVANSSVAGISQNAEDGALMSSRNGDKVEEDVDAARFKELREKLANQR